MQLIQRITKTHGGDNSPHNIHEIDTPDNEETEMRDGEIIYADGANLILEHDTIEEIAQRLQRYETLTKTRMYIFRQDEKRMRNIDSDHLNPIETPLWGTKA